MTLSEIQLPDVGRPRGEAWQRLQAEGVDWEGQILLVGAEIDLAARLILTIKSLAICRGGEIVLDLQRDWILPATFMRANGIIDLHFLLPGEAGGQPPLQLRARDGRHDAIGFLRRLEAPPPPIEMETAPVGWDDPNYYQPAEPTPRLTRWARRKEQQPGAEPVEPLDLMTLVSALDSEDFPPLPPAKQRSSVVWKGGENLPALNGVEIAQTWDPQDEGWALKPISGLHPRSSRHSHLGWIVRLSGLALLIGAIAALSSGWLPPGIDDDDEPTPVTSEVAAGGSSAETPTPTTTALPQLVPQSEQTASAVETAAALGVGGGDLTETFEAETVTPTKTQTNEPEPTEPVFEPTVAATTAVPTEIIEGPAATETAAVTVTPTGHVVFAPPTATNSAEPTATQTTELAATFESSEIAGPATETSEAPGGTVTVDSGIEGTTFADGDVQFEIDRAQRAESIQDLTLPPVNDSEWVVLLITATNAAGDETTFNMSDLILVDTDTGETFSIDETSQAVAQFLGYSPAYGDDDAVALASDDETQLVLVYLVPAESGGLALQSSGITFPLATALRLSEEEAANEP